jgi:hypothetical protein
MNSILYFTAIEARAKCEKFAMSEEAKGYDFGGCGRLSSMCAVASFVLKEMLKIHKIKSKVAQGYFVEEFNTHCWIEVGNNIIDITATQFGKYPEVVLTNYGHKWYNKEQDIKSSNDLKRQGWGKRQCPTQNLVRRILNA